MTRRNNLIPQSEVWIKIGGDHGRGSFKLSSLVANCSKAAVGNISIALMRYSSFLV